MTTVDHRFAGRAKRLDGRVTNRRPVIGLTSYVERVRYGDWDEQATMLPRSYADAVVRAGGAPVLLPSIGPVQREVIDVLDGFVLTGGPDVDPANYGAEPHERTTSRPERDAVELGLLAHALERGLPVLGVCRGLQLLDVAHGGTLHQHLPDLLGHADLQPGGGVFGHLSVEFTAGTRAAGILGEQANVRCSHHQAVDAVGSGLRVSGRSADGVVQAVEGTGEQFLLAVQFHPEENDADDRLFTAFVDACRG
ncbi:MAG: gamma-glutamyl-gamma-aminobutyrate hydrolase family protein [Janthinobacterium lividum]